MKSLTSARGFTARAIAVSWRLFESGAVPQSTHLLTHAQVIADLTLPIYARLAIEVAVGHRYAHSEHMNRGRLDNPHPRT